MQRIYSQPARSPLVNLCRGFNCFKSLLLQCQSANLFHRKIWTTLPSLCRMLVSCPVSCNQCKNKCDDNNVYCKVEPCEGRDDDCVVDIDDDQNSDDKDDIYSLQDWADLGECTKNPDYMNIYCQKVRYEFCLHVISINVRVLVPLSEMS